MTPSQLKLRTDLLARQDAALDRWPQGNSPEFLLEVTAVASELENLARDADTAGGDTIERVRNWRFVGDAYADLVVDNDAKRWRDAADAYQRADALLEGSDNPVERMKLDFRYGRALFGLSNAGKNAALVHDARDRFISALGLARVHMPEVVPDVEQSVADTEQVLAIATQITGLDAKIGQLNEELASQGQGSTSEQTGWPSEFQDLFGQLQNVYQNDVQAGKVTPVRQQALNPILDQLGELLKYRPSDLGEMTSQGSELRELMARMTPMLGSTGQGLAASSKSRADAVWRRFSAIKTFLVQDVTRPHGGSETQFYGMELYQRCGHADTFIHQHGNDDLWIRTHERDALRQLALDVQTYSLRNHLTFAQPIWPSPPLAQEPSSVSYSGGAKTQLLVADACERTGLDLLASQAAKDYAIMRWDQMRASHVAVFDFTNYRVPNLAQPVDLAETGPLAAISYELGIALTLGRPVVVIANEGQNLPFDVDITPIRLHADGQDEDRIAEGLDDAQYGLQRGGGNSLPASRAFLYEYFAKHPNFVVAQSLKLIDDDAERDAIKFRRFVEPLLGAAGVDAPKMIFPSWPGSYPPSIEGRLFHVTAFGPEWAGNTMKIAAHKCASAAPSVQYIRGDQVMDTDIIGSIWDNLCQATHVLVDLTGLNANVALELGILHVLGRRVLLVTQDEQAQNYFQAIAKLRIHRYSLQGTGEPPSLGHLLEHFLMQTRQQT
jgi:hypothetical protein